MYHEKQKLQLCALHTINNLLQRAEFSRQQMDSLCDQLSSSLPTSSTSSSSLLSSRLTSWFNQHRSPLNTGNYDVNVVSAALRNCGLSLIWFDKRRSLSCLILEHIFGFIINAPSPLRLGALNLPFTTRHWFCVRSFDEPPHPSQSSPPKNPDIDEAAHEAMSYDEADAPKLSPVFYNMDSKLDRPVRIGDETALLNYIGSLLENPAVQLFIVADGGVAENGGWISSDARAQSPT